MATKYQTNPGAIRTPSFKASPLSPLVTTGQGTQSHPVPPKPPKYGRKLKPAPVSVAQPGASGTI